MNPLADEALDAFAVSRRKFWISERHDNLLQLAILRGYLPAEFGQSRQRRGEPFPHDPQQGLGLHGHSQLEQIVDASLVGIGQQSFRLRRRRALVEILGKLQSGLGMSASNLLPYPRDLFRQQPGVHPVGGGAWRWTILPVLLVRHEIRLSKAV